ncbi:hypothetical protein [Coraliomargarita parva]|uniref:hypothetical protein n=1 Tax=Coraliomargarita parva TaxID=3014050 RepID=UPI0022B38D31|nr:hypothetical protein [Coraliomargarita parva]
MSKSFTVLARLLLLLFLNFLCSCRSYTPDQCRVNQGAIEEKVRQTSNRDDCLNWFYFPDEYIDLTSKREKSLKSYPESISSQYRYIDEVPIFGKDLLVGLLGTKNGIAVQVKTESRPKAIFTIPNYGHFLHAKKWSSTNGDYLIIYVDLKATKNLSMLYVLDSKLNVVLKECYPRGIALGSGCEEFFAVKYRPDCIRYYGLSLNGKLMKRPIN